jgi:hypothetical protein|eukprot:COSAG01_NODE_2175_length_8221_cov_34.993722_7_plen_182_part_00
MTIRAVVLVVLMQPQLMINALEMRFPGIVATVLMHGTDLVSSGLDTAPTQLLYAFLSHHVLGRGAGDGAAGGRAAAAAAWAHTVTVMSTADDLPSSSAASGGAARRTPSPPRPIYLPGPVGCVLGSQARFWPIPSADIRDWCCRIATEGFLSSHVSRCLQARARSRARARARGWRRWRRCR